MEIYPTTKVIFDRRNQASPHKKGIVEVEIYFHRKRKWFTTGVQVLPKHWNEKKRVVNRVDSIDLKFNTFLSKIMHCIFGLRPNNYVHL